MFVNDAYKVELGNSGIGFKSADRFVSMQHALRVMDILNVARIEGKIVGVIGIDVQDGVADLGPIAVDPCLKGNGLGSRLLRYAESLHPITTLGVVSCRTDILPFYEKRGYQTFAEEDWDTMGIADLTHITRRGLTYIMKKKINNI